MFYVFGTIYEDELTYYLDPDKYAIFRFDSEADMQHALDEARQLNANYKAYRLLEE